MIPRSHGKQLHQICSELKIDSSSDLESDLSAMKGDCLRGAETGLSGHILFRVAGIGPLLDGVGWQGKLHMQVFVHCCFSF